MAFSSSVWGACADERPGTARSRAVARAAAVRMVLLRASVEPSKSAAKGGRFLAFRIAPSTLCHSSPQPATARLRLAVAAANDRRGTTMAEKRRRARAPLDVYLN